MEMTNRPLSPHLQVYRPQLTSVLSIAHRGTGVVLTIGTLVLVYWLFALAGGDADGIVNSHVPIYYEDGDDAKKAGQCQIQIEISPFPSCHRSSYYRINGPYAKSNQSSGSIRP